MNESRIDAVAKAIFIAEMLETARDKDVKLTPRLAEALWHTTSADSKMHVWARTLALAALTALAALDGTEAR